MVPYQTLIKPIQYERIFIIAENIFLDRHPKQSNIGRDTYEPNIQPYLVGQ